VEDLVHKYEVIRQKVKETLGSAVYDTIVDVGCGSGALGEILRKNCRQLIGLELHPIAGERAKRTGLYNEVRGVPAERFDFSGADAVFLIDSIEHLPKSEGISLIKKLQENCKFIFIHTPGKFHRNLDIAELTGNSFEEHVSFWGDGTLESLGFKVSRVPFRGTLKERYGDMIFGVWSSR